MESEDWRKIKTGKAWEHSSHGWRQVDVEGRGGAVTAKTTHWTIYLSVFWLHNLVWWKLLVLTGKKLSFMFSMYIGPLPPYVHLGSTHVMNAPRSSPFSASLPLLCIVEGKSGGGLGTSLWMNLVVFLTLCTWKSFTRHHLLTRKLNLSVRSKCQALLSKP